jgi:hypothetical protein
VTRYKDYDAFVIFEALRGIGGNHGDQLGFVGFLYDLVFFARGLKIAQAAKALADARSIADPNTVPKRVLIITSHRSWIARKGVPKGDGLTSPIVGLFVSCSPLVSLCEPPSGENKMTCHKRTSARR